MLGARSACRYPSASGRNGHRHFWWCSMNSPNRVIRRAEVVDVPAVVLLLERASAWLRTQGVDQWPQRFEPDVLRPAADVGETWVVEEDGELVATVTADADDPAWTDIPGRAIYLHRMAVSRHGEGLGSWILRWASAASASSGHGSVRLDCLASNERLCRYYEAHGFEARGDVFVGGSPGQRQGPSAVQTRVRRYERRPDTRLLDG